MDDWSKDISPLNDLANAESTVSDEAARKRARKFDDALYASLECRAQTERARALVDTVARLVAQHGQTAGTRTNKRDKKAADLRVALQGFLADLLKARASRTAHGYAYRAVRPGAFTDSGIGYRVFKNLTITLAALRLLEIYRGFQTFSTHDGHRSPHPSVSKATCFRATQHLLDICAEHGIRPADFQLHFLEPLPENPLLLRGASTVDSTGRKMTGKMIRFEPTEHTQGLERDLKVLNAFFEGFELSGGEHRGYLRIFNNGNDPAFRWNMGGRLYSYGEDNYQQDDREQRLRMTINGEPVCEIDIRASYLTILHAWCGEQLDPERDPYDVPGLGPELRDLVKLWVTASFGNNAPITKWPTDARKRYWEKTGKMIIGKRHSAAKVGALIVAAHPLLARLGQSVKGHRCGWAELMYAESQAMLMTMLELMRAGVPSLAVHDSIIVPISKHHLALGALGSNYRKFTNATPALKSHRSEGLEFSVTSTLNRKQ